MPAINKDANKDDDGQDAEQKEDQDPGTGLAHQRLGPAALAVWPDGVKTFWISAKGGIFQALMNDLTDFGVGNEDPDSKGVDLTQQVPGDVAETKRDVDVGKVDLTKAGDKTAPGRVT